MNTTPGPWIVDQLTNADLHGDFMAVRSAEDRSKVIAITGRMIGGELQDEASANTILIASTPDMLDALIAIQEELQEALGEWFGVEPPYIPEDLMSYYYMTQIISRAFEKIHAEAE